MLKNYLTIAWRTFSRHKLYTAINVLGLALGICACICIYLITGFDLGFDKFHKDKDHIYRIVGELKRASGESIFLNSPTDEVAGFRNQIPGFEATAGILFYSAPITIQQDHEPAKKFISKIDGTYVTSTVITWPDYFTIFHYQWLQGSAAALKDPYKVVLTEKRARQYFGDIPLNQMLGKTVTYDDSLPVSVAGIVKDWDQHTDFGYTDFISIATVNNPFLKKQFPADDWTSLSPHRSMAFVKLAANSSVSEINSRFAAFIKEHVKIKEQGGSLAMKLQPIGDIHFTSEFHRGDDGDNFRKAYMPELYLLMGLSGFILLIAAINFINLSTAQSVQRAKEIGVRKVLGSSKTKILYQFLTETGVLTLSAVLLSVMLVKPVLTVFSSYVPQGVAFHPFEWPNLLFLLVITVATILLAGFYPAKVMASYLPVLGLKGVGSQKSADKMSLRKALIVFQFTISLVFIIGVMVIAKQIRFMANSNKGFTTDAIVTVSNWNDHEGKLRVYAEAIRHIPGVQATIVQGTDPMGFAQNIDHYKYKLKSDITMHVLTDIGDDHFIPFYGMKLIAGKNMPSGDSLTEIVINESFSKSLGFNTPRDAIGKVLHQQNYQGERPVAICGVVADYHTGSFHDAIQPLVIENVVQRRTGVAIKLAAVGASTQTALSAMELEWKKIFPDMSFDYHFLNESINQLFDQERKTAWLMNLTMGITIFISCMGLFGLGMFTAQRRTKEIGIRKVLGASVANIAAMLSRDFVILVLIAFVIAAPVAGYFMSQWLQDFVYRTTISWWIFAGAGLMAIGIALITISYQAIKAALANPVKSLRSE